MSFTNLRSCRILVIGHDRGGVNLLFPLLSHWVKHASIETSFLSTPEIEYEASSLISTIKMASYRNNYGKQQQNLWTTEDRELEIIFKTLRWDVIFTSTSAENNLEKMAWRLANQYSIPSIAICDMWTEYERRFRDGAEMVLPDLLLVLDERMALEAQGALGPSVRTEVVGSPHFAQILAGNQSRNRFGSKVRFISEPAASFFPRARINEFLIAEMLVEILGEMGMGSELLLRLHPRDDAEAWRRFAYVHRNHGIGLDCEPSWACYQSTKMAVGISSMMLTELAIVGVPVASFRFPGSDESYYCLPEKDLGISVLRSKGELKDWLKNPQLPKVNPQFVQLHKSAVERITDLVLLNNKF